MIGYRWMRAAARIAVGVLTVLPALALVIAVLVDRGPDGESRVSLFPIALLAFDPFAWTCARNSLIFATALTGLSLIAGLWLGSAMAGPPYPGRRPLRGAVASMLAAPPACLALGLVGIWGTQGLGPASMTEAASGGLSLENWGGWPKWLLWVWASCPGAVALVAIATAAVRARIDPAWGDAARLAGAGPIGAWRSVTWPLIRPAAARAAAIIFPLALLEPGVPLILGLRRTLAFQIVEAAGRPDPFPRIAVWSAMAAVFSLAGRWLLRYWGGRPLVAVADEAHLGARARSTAGRARLAPAVSAGLIMALAAILGWLPILGLVRLLGGAGATAGDSTASSLWKVGLRAVGPPVPQVALHSLILGIEVGLGTLILAWLLQPDAATRLARTFGSRLAGRFALMPPLLLGVGLLALLNLGAQAARSMKGLTGLTQPTARIEGLAPELAVGRNPWPILTAAVGLSVGLRLLRTWRRAAERRPDSLRSGLAAALQAGATSSRARSVAALKPGRWIGGLLLASCLAAVNLTPALLFTPWIDGRTAAPAMLTLAGGADDDRRQAAGLAFLLIVGNLTGLCAARFAPAPPPEWDRDPP